MTTRDPRSRPSAPPVREGAREPTQSLQLEIDPVDDDLDDSAISHPSLALGTHEKRERSTRIESPSAQRRTPPPPEPAASRASGSRSRPPPVPASSDDPELRLGAQLGSYQVIELLGKGGMGYVYRAEHVKLGREVALKLLRSDYARRRDAVARFFQEARTVNRVRHRNIVDVTDFVELGDGTTFIIMELLSGVSLGKWARSGIDLPRALAVLVQICDGLGAAHAVGVIHRDLKPDNVIVVPTSDGAELVKLLDFGVAKLLNRDDEDLGFQTQAGSVIGTPAYMSPEQAGGMAIDHRSDIYSLGAIMYELFCGQPMFRGRSFGEYVRKHLTEMPVRPRATAGGADLDPRIEALILKCLEKEPALRFGHILELRDGLLHMLGGDPHSPHSPHSQYSPHSASYSAVGYQSAMRPVGMVTGLALPLAPPPHATPQPGGIPSAAYPVLPSSPVLGTSASYSVQVSPMPSMAQMTHIPSTLMTTPQPTPWWVWAMGGVVAVGLGIGAAVFYARGADAHAPAPAGTAPVAQVAPGLPASPASPIGPKLVEVRFDSLPQAGVFADGRSAELCRTPCAMNVDLGDGGPTDQRAFVVRETGYQDKHVVVDLTAAHPELHATLDRISGATGAVDPVTPPPVTPGPPTHPVRPPRPGRPHGDPKPVTVDPKPAVADDPKPVVADEPKPGPRKPDGKKPGDTVDQSETLDPFRKK